MLEVYLKVLCENVELIIVLLEERSSQKKELAKWLSKDEVMVYLRISSSTYYLWLKKGILKPSSSIGEKRYLIEDIEKIALGRKGRERFKLS